MKLSVLIIFLLNSFVLLYSQSNDPEIESMYKSIAICPIKYHTINNDSIYLREGKTFDTLIIQSYPEKIIFLRANKLNHEPPFDYDFVIINKQSYIIEKLFYKNDSLFHKNKSEPTCFNYLAGYTFCFNKTNYLCLFFINSKIPTSTPNYFIFLSNLSQPEKRPILLNEQASFTPDCFGDFNEDGKLDYLQWSYGNIYNPIMRFFSLEENEFILNKYYHLKIDTDKNENYYINHKESRWFY